MTYHIWTFKDGHWEVAFTDLKATDAKRIADQRNRLMGMPLHIAVPDGETPTVDNWSWPN